MKFADSCVIASSIFTGSSGLQFCGEGGLSHCLDNYMFL